MKRAKRLFPISVIYVTVFDGMLLSSGSFYTYYRDKATPAQTLGSRTYTKVNSLNCCIDIHMSDIIKKGYLEANFLLCICCLLFFKQIIKHLEKASSLSLSLTNVFMAGLTNPMAYETRRFNAAFTRAFQQSLF